MKTLRWLFGGRAYRKAVRLQKLVARVEAAILSGELSTSPAPVVAPVKPFVPVYTNARVATAAETRNSGCKL